MGGQNGATEPVQNCKQLREYVLYIEKVRTYAATMPIEEAVNRAVDECIKENILADFLSRNKAEAVAMSIFEYDQEAHMKCVHQEGKVLGIAESTLELLHELDSIPDNIEHKILQEKDLQQLKAWLKLAAKSSSIEEFIENM